MAKKGRDSFLKNLLAKKGKGGDVEDDGKKGKFEKKGGRKSRRGGRR